jgi:hypothetical protein
MEAFVDGLGVELGLFKRDEGDEAEGVEGGVDATHVVQWADEF